jgi:hypothetical protein
MQPLGSGGTKFTGLLDRVILIGYLAVILALDKSDTFTVPQVNCRYDIHLCCPKKLNSDSSDFK